MRDALCCWKSPVAAGGRRVVGGGEAGGRGGGAGLPGGGGGGRAREASGCTWEIRVTNLSAAWHVKHGPLRYWGGEGTGYWDRRVRVIFCQLRAAT